MRAIILHGRPDKEQWEDPNFPSSSNYYWLPWAQKQLALNGIPAETPEVPNAWQPKYGVWRQTFERYELDDDTILIGHSCGAGFLVRWLSEHPETSVNKVILVAPWIDPLGDPGNTDSADFFDFEIDRALVARTARVTIINSSNDMETIQRSVEKLRAELPDIKYVELQNRGHFFDEGANEFPELLEEVLA